MIKRFTCDNFRNVSCNNLEFERINILIGPNNAGKSNFIRALSFAANMVSGQKTEETGFLSELKRNGWQTTANKRTDASSFKLIWNFLLEDRPVKYQLHTNVSSKRSGNYITEEALDGAEAGAGYTKPFNFFRCHTPDLGVGQFSEAGLSKVKNKRLFAKVNQQESVLLQMDNLFFENKTMFSSTFLREDIRNVLESMRTYFRGFYSYSCTSFDIAAIRELQDAQNDGSSLKKNGENFVNVFSNIVDSDSTFKDRYLRILRRLANDCEDIAIRDAGGKIWMELKFNGYWFSLSEVSDGTIHLLLLLLMLNLPEHSGISLLAIDEPEMNLHPAWQKTLANELLRCRSFKQCFVSTHSPDFLDEFTEGFLSGDVAVFVFDPAKKNSIRKLNRAELVTDLQNWTLGDLYRIGDPVIGGWPQ